MAVVGSVTEITVQHLPYLNPKAEFCVYFDKLVWVEAEENEKTSLELLLAVF